MDAELKSKLDGMTKKQLVKYAQTERMATVPEHVQKSVDKTRQYVFDLIEKEENPVYKHFVAIKKELKAIYDKNNIGYFIFLFQQHQGELDVQMISFCDNINPAFIMSEVMKADSWVYHNMIKSHVANSTFSVVFPDGKMRSFPGRINESIFNILAQNKARGEEVFFNDNNLKAIELLEKNDMGYFAVVVQVHEGRFNAFNLMNPYALASDKLLSNLIGAEAFVFDQMKKYDEANQLELTNLKLELARHNPIKIGGYHPLDEKMKAYFQLRIDNITANAPYLKECKTINDIPKAPDPNAVAIIVGSGPSLQTHLNNGEFVHLENAYIVAIDRALKPLLEHGVVPDLCVTIDPDPICASLIDIPEEVAKKIPLIVASSSHPDTVKMWKGERYFISMYNANMETWELFAEKNPDAMKVWKDGAEFVPYGFESYAEEMCKAPVVMCAGNSGDLAIQIMASRYNYKCIGFIGCDFLYAGDHPNVMKYPSYQMYDPEGNVGYDVVDCLDRKSTIEWIRLWTNQGATFFNLGGRGSLYDSTIHWVGPSSKEFKSILDFAIGTGLVGRDGNGGVQKKQ